MGLDTRGQPLWLISRIALDRYVPIHALAKGIVCTAQAIRLIRLYPMSGSYALPIIAILSHKLYADTLPPCTASPA